MLRNFFLFISLVCGPVVGYAEGVHKCVTSEGISYQGAPCHGSELPITAAAVQSAPAPQTRPANGDAAPECVGRPRAMPWVPGRPEAICLGMPDDQVLNLAGWGRPAKIVRTRAPREWRETWKYDTASAGSRQLRFVNGRLAQIDAEPVDDRSDSIARVASN